MMVSEIVDIKSDSVEQRQQHSERSFIRELVSDWHLTRVQVLWAAPIIGWLGVALTGSDTSSNALFANLQKVTAQQIGLSPNLTVGANSSGGVLGKMISPQNLAVGTSATGLQGKEGDLLRLVLRWSIGLTIAMSILVVLQAYVFRFMVP
jgi:L-lactate permease